MLARLWNLREARTFQAEKGIFTRLTHYAPSKAGGVSFSDIEQTLHDFNNTREKAEGTLQPTQKLALLEKVLNDWLDAGTPRRTMKSST